MKIASIQTRLIGYTLVAILFAAAIPLYIAIEEQRELYRESVRTHIDGLSINLASDLVSILSEGGDEFEITRSLLQVDVYAHIKLARVYSKDTSLLGQYVSPSVTDFAHLDQKYTPATLQKLPRGVNVIGPDMVAFRVIGDEQYPLGYLLVVDDYHAPLADSTRNMLFNLLPFALLVVIVLMLVAMFSQRQILKPLIRLSDFTKEVDKTGDYSLRIHLPGKNEVSNLADNISQMMNKIDLELEKNKRKTQQVIEQQRAMERLANFDSLTGLPNRQFFMELLRLELDKAARKQSDVAIMFLDLDEFKNVNDTLGHDVGDMLLIAVTERVKSFLRGGDVLSRLSGDEFLILLPENPDILTLRSIAKRILEGLQEPFSVQEWSISVGVSIGIAQASQADFNLSALISYADVAMYRSKTTGKRGITVFDLDMLADNKRRLLIASAIDDGVDSGDFSVHYQPKVDCAGSVVGVEALARWYSPTLGHVSPVEFITIAEQSGSISKVTSWVICQVFQDLDRICSIIGEHCLVSINLSALDIRRPDFFDVIRQNMDIYNVNPVNIEFEVTESAYLESFENANTFFSRISALGSGIALDDFGTGYSSLGYLTQLKLNTLKIDKKFVDGLGLSERSTLITKTIVEMAKHLNLRVCAEGVESREQADMLLAFGCDYLQGFLFSKPVPLALLEEDAERNSVISGAYSLNV